MKEFVELVETHRRWPTRRLGLSVTPRPLSPSQQQFADLWDTTLVKLGTIIGEKLELSQI